MSGLVVAASFLLLLGVAFGKQETPLRPEARVEEESRLQETKVLTIESVLSTVVNTVYHTVRVYPTCTSTVEGVSACVAGEGGQLPEELLLSHISGVAPHHRPALTTQAPGEGESSSFSLVEMVLPSCDCVDGRAPRRLRGNQLITIRSTTTLTEHSIVTRTDPSTTVSITYNGCVPTDALVTATCRH